MPYSHCLLSLKRESRLSSEVLKSLGAVYCSPKNLSSDPISQTIFFSTDLSSEMSKVSNPRASRPSGRRGGRTPRGAKRPQQRKPPSTPLVPGLLDQSNPLSTPMPKKRSQKSKGDLLLLKLSKGLDQPESPHPKRPPEDFETPSGERPRRRAAQV